MKNHHFSLIIRRDDSCGDQPEDLASWMEDVAEQLAEKTGGLPDLSVMGHSLGLELVLHRDSQSLESALASAIADARSIGLQVACVQLDEDAINSTLPVAS